MTPLTNVEMEDLEDRTGMRDSVKRTATKAGADVKIEGPKKRGSAKKGKLPALPAVPAEFKVRNAQLLRLCAR
jgi:hypothetical protein